MLFDFGRGQGRGWGGETNPPHGYLPMVLEPLIVSVCVWSWQWPLVLSVRGSFRVLGFLSPVQGWPRTALLSLSSASQLSLCV